MLVIPSLVAGGMERVMTELAGYFSGKTGHDIWLVSLVNRDLFYDLPERITFIAPRFRMNDGIRLLSLIKTYFFLRKQVRRVKPYTLLSFGGKYNSFVLLACKGLSVKTYISDRSRPGIGYGWLLDHLNPITYRRADGIIAQTEHARQVIFEKTGHENIKVIGNPIHIINAGYQQRKTTILNVGRFIPSKRQEELVRIFADVRTGPWKLIFVGDGPGLPGTKSLAVQLGIEKYVEFVGFTKDVGKYYAESMIFAFTSLSEGFPNALAEAMSYGLACISYDCEAGPGDLIDDGVNGFLLPLNEGENYRIKLQYLMDSPEVRQSMGKAAIEKIRSYDISNIGNEYLEFITS